MKVRSKSNKDSRSSKDTSGVSSSSRRSPVGEIALAGTDFVNLATVPYKAQTIGAVVGPPGCGKTSFVTRYCPDPIAMINFDGRSEDEVRRAIKEDGKIIPYMHVDAPEVNNKTDETKQLSEEETAACNRALGDFLNNYGKAVALSKIGKVRTICLDTGTELSDIALAAARGHLGKNEDYGASKNKVNRMWWHIFQLARQGNANLIVLGREKEIWKGRKGTGRFTIRGNETQEEGVDWLARLVMIPRVTVRGTKKTFKMGSWELSMMKAGVNGEEMGQTYRSKDWEDWGAFAYVCERQYPEVEVDAWL